MKYKRIVEYSLKKCLNLFDKRIRRQTAAGKLLAAVANLTNKKEDEKSTNDSRYSDDDAGLAT